MSGKQRSNITGSHRNILQRNLNNNPNLKVLWQPQEEERKSSIHKIPLWTTKSMERIKAHTYASQLVQCRVETQGLYAWGCSWEVGNYTKQTAHTYIVGDKMMLILNVVCRMMPTQKRFWSFVLVKSQMFNPSRLVQLIINQHGTSSQSLTAIYICVQDKKTRINCTATCQSLIFVSYASGDFAAVMRPPCQ